MKLKQTAKMLLMISGFTGLVATIPLTIQTQTASANDKLECAILPDNICGGAKKGNLEENGIWLLMLFVISIMTYGVGIVAVAMVGYAAFLYTTAQDNASQTKDAIDKIRNVVIGIGAYALMWAILQFLIPGGVFA